MSKADDLRMGIAELEDDLPIADADEDALFIDETNCRLRDLKTGLKELES